MPADERATLREKVLSLYDLVYHLRPYEGRQAIEQALKEADRLAREDAARIAKNFRHNLNGGTVRSQIAAAIRASITTDEGK